jgi:hypothetical protein
MQSLETCHSFLEAIAETLCDADGEIGLDPIIND